MPSTKKVALLGADKFILALESHDRHAGTSGNSCKYILELEGNFDEASFFETVKNNELAQWMARFQLSGKISNSNHWKQSEKTSIPIEIINETEVNTIAHPEIKLTKNTAPLFYFHIIKKSARQTTIIFTWHHLLMDGYGATLFLRNLIEPIKTQSTPKVKSPFTLSVFREMVKAKRFISASAKGNIATLENSFQPVVEQTQRIISFTEEETKSVDEQARLQGAKFGQGSFLLACTAISVNNYLKRKGKAPKDFWIPVPHDNRKKGSTWPVLGNHLSFLFYRMSKAHLENKKECIASLNDQMSHQIKERIPSAYSHLMNYMRIVPSNLYARMIKGPSGKSLSTFLFTVAAQYPSDLLEMFNCKVMNALSIPPNTYPPGLTFAYNRFEGQLQIVVLSYAHLFSEQEMNQLEIDLKNELLGQS